MAMTSVPLAKNSPEERWRKLDLQRQIIDVGLALEESDLLAAVTIGSDTSNNPMQDVGISLLQFSTLRNHPDAVIPALKVTTAPQYGDRYDLTIEILGDHLALLLHYELPGVTDLLHVYNWKTGDLVVALEDVGSVYRSLTFLQPGVLILANESQLSLDLLRIPASPAVPNAISLLVQLSLPVVKASSTTGCITIRSSPKPITPASSPSFLRYAGKQAYHSKPEESLVLLNLHMFDAFSRRRFSVVVHRRSIIALIPAGVPPNSASTSISIPAIPWKEWGPRVTRWFNSDHVALDWMIATHGQRYVRPTSDAISTPSPIKLLDFNPFHVWMVEREMRAESGKSTAISDGAKSPAGSCGEQTAKGKGRKLRKAMTRLIFNVKKVRRLGGGSSTLSSSPKKAKEKDALVPKQLYRDELPKASRRLVLDDDTNSFTSFGIFENEVDSYLPYIELTSKESFDHDAVLMDEERLVGLRMGLFSGPKRWVDVMRF